MWSCSVKCLSWHPSFIHILLFLSWPAGDDSVFQSKSMQPNSQLSLERHLGWPKSWPFWGRVHFDNRDTYEKLLKSIKSLFWNNGMVLGKIKRAPSHVCYNGETPLTAGPIESSMCPSPTQPPMWSGHVWSGVAFVLNTQRLHKYSIEANMFRCIRVFTQVRLKPAERAPGSGVVFHWIHWFMVELWTLPLSSRERACGRAAQPPRKGPLAELWAPQIAVANGLLQSYLRGISCTHVVNTPTHTILKRPCLTKGWVALDCHLCKNNTLIVLMYASNWSSAADSYSVLRLTRPSFGVLRNLKT